ncbi:MAG: AAA-like domain-containing protein, partial [Microcoleaceae cyanobacterium]
SKCRLESEGYLCASLDMSSFVSEEMTLEQLYKGIAAQLWLELDLLEKFNLKSWWKGEAELSAQQRLGQFITKLLSTYFAQEKLFIFIDEIDSILKLPFAVDDFFALIRFCYNQRALNPEYRRLNFAIFGVAAPTDLIQQHTLTPFNIGQSIELRGFQTLETKPLAQGLSECVQQPEVLLREILNWTAGQPFLTQKLCQLVWQLSQERISQDKLLIPPGTEAFWIERVVRSHLINHWESQDEPEHLRTIRDRLLHRGHCTGRMLALYQQLLQAGEVRADDSPEQIELLLSGLVRRSGGRLQIKNRIYQEVFNHQWVTEKLTQLRPYSQALEAWIAAKQQDSSRLLRGQALQDAHEWAHGKSLSDMDYQFLAASQELDRSEVQTALEAERAKEVTARLVQEQKATRLQRYLLAVVSTALLIAGSLGGMIFWQYRQARLNEVRAIALSSEALLVSNQKLEALIEALRAKRKLEALGDVNLQIRTQVNTVLRQALYQADEANRLVGHQKAIWDVAFSPDGKTIATVSGDKTVKLWTHTGQLVTTFKGHQSPIWGVAFSPDGKTIASASWDKTVKLWTVEGRLEQTLSGHTEGVWSVAFSPDSQFLVSASEDNTLKLWHRSGRLVQTLVGHEAAVWDVSFSPDGQFLVSASEDSTVRLWRRDGQLQRIFRGHKGPVWQVAFSPEGERLASAGDDHTVKLWNLTGELEQTLESHQATAWDVAFSPDGNTLASTSWDRTVKLWSVDGTLLKTFSGHQERVRGIAFSPDGNTIASAAEDETVRLWRLHHPLIQNFRGHRSGVVSLAIRSDGQQIASGSDDTTVKLWDADGNLLQTLKGHQAGVLGVAFSPDHQTIASVSWDQTAKLWTSQGELQQTLDGHKGPIWDVQFSPDGQQIATASRDQTVKLWQPDGQLLTTLEGHHGEVRAIAYSPDGQTIVSGSLDRTLKLWTSQGQLLKILTGHRDGVSSIDFSPDGRLFASAGFDGTIRLWSQEGFLLETLMGHRDGVISIAFSRDGEMLASAGLDRTVKLWTRTGTLLKTLYGHQGAIWQLDFFPTADRLISVGEGQSILLWNLDKLMDSDETYFACLWLQDYLAVHPPESDQPLCNFEAMD